MLERITKSGNVIYKTNLMYIQVQKINTFKKIITPAFDGSIDTQNIPRSLSRHASSPHTQGSYEARGTRHEVLGTMYGTKKTNERNVPKNTRQKKKKKKSEQELTRHGQGNDTTCFPQKEKKRKS